MESHDYKRRRAATGYRQEKQKLLSELRECELDMNHLVILTCSYQGAPIDPKYLARKEQVEARMKELKARLEKICAPA